MLSISGQKHYRGVNNKDLTKGNVSRIRSRPSMESGSMWHPSMHEQASTPVDLSLAYIILKTDGPFLVLN